MFKDYVATILLALAAISMIIATVLSLNLAAVHYKCGVYAEGTGLETKVTGTMCFVKVDNSWHALQELRYPR